jgi:hypothetical protein
MPGTDYWRPEYAANPTIRRHPLPGNAGAEELVYCISNPPPLLGSVEDSRNPLTKAQLAGKGDSLGKNRIAEQDHS